MDLATMSWQSGRQDYSLENVKGCIWGGNDRLKFTNETVGSVLLPLGRNNL